MTFSFYFANSTRFSKSLCKGDWGPFSSGLTWLRTLRKPSFVAVLKTRRFPVAPLMICRVVRVLLAFANISVLMIPSTGRGIDNPYEQILRLMAFSTFPWYNSLKVLSTKSDGPESTTISPCFPLAYRVNVFIIFSVFVRDMFCWLGHNSSLVCYTSYTSCFSQGISLCEGMVHHSSHIYYRLFGLAAIAWLLASACLLTIFVDGAVAFGLCWVPFLLNLTTFAVLSWFLNSFACISFNSRTLSAFMRPDKSRSSRRPLRRREFDWQFKMTCSLISLSGFAKSQVFD